MAASLLALAGAVTYGIADFFGGLATRRSTTLPVVVLSQSIASVVLLVALPLSASTPGPADFLWGAAAGIAGAVGIALLYHGLALGPMAVVAPTTAVMGASVPILVGLALGERPQVTALVGVVLALPAIALLSRPGPAPGERGSGMPWRSARVAMAAGVSLGGFLVLIGQTDPQAGLWPLLPARAVSLALLISVALVTRRSLRPGPGSLRLIAPAGLLDMGANVLILLAVQRGLLSLTAVLSSLYPASTVVLARVALGERMRAMQLVGFGLALVAVALISLP